MSCGAVAAVQSTLKLSHRHPAQSQRRRTAALFPCFLCCSRGGDQLATTTATLPRLVLHDSLDAAGIDTTHARAARKAFCEQIGQLSELHGETSIAISKGADLGKAALQIAAEDDSLVSHSSVPLPVDAFVERLDDLSMGFCPHYMPRSCSPPELFLTNLERYFYVHRGFNRAAVASDARALYLHSVLTCRSGTAVMLSLIYSEMVKMLRIYGFLDFDVEIYFPHDLMSLPRGYPKQKSKLSDQPHIMTAKLLLTDTLRNLKSTFWPFQFDDSRSLFLRAAHAPNYIMGPTFVGQRESKSYNNFSGSEIASFRAAQHRLERGVWTSVQCGDMRRALAACERLILMRTDYRELRDYAVLLYHCGHYADCLHFLKLYKNSREPGPTGPITNDKLEEDSMENLMSRVNLILGEEGWSKHTIGKSYWSKSLEPW